MKVKRSIFIIVFLLSNLSLFAKSNIFWEVKSESGATVYLLGSVHLADKSFYPLPKVIEQSFAKSDYLVTEINLKKIDVVKLLDKMSYPPNDSLAAHIADTTMNKLVNIFKNMGMNRQIINRFKPAFIIVTLSTMNYSEAGFSADYGIDNYFTNKAGKKSILELESMETQIDILNMMNKEGEEDKIINGALSQTEDTEGEADSLISAWKSGNLQELERIINKMEEAEYADSKELSEALLDNRNIKMTEKIKEYLSDCSKKKYFVVVGAAHLIGEKGIVRELEKAGYKPIRK